MQDNWKGDIDDQLTDRAWEDMEKVLDREMPQERKKRRFLYWWWPGAAAAILLLAVTFWWIGQDNGDLDSALSTEIVSKETPNRSTDRLSGEAGKSLHADPSNEGEANSGPAATAILSHKATTPNPKQESQQELVQGVREIDPLPERKKDPVVAEPLDIELTEVDLTREGMARNPVEVADPLNNSSLVLLEEKEIAAHDLHPLSVRSPLGILGKGTIGAEAGVTASGIGYTAGLGWQSPVKGKWEIRAGIAYSDRLESYDIAISAFLSDNHTPITNTNDTTITNPVTDTGNVEFGEGLSGLGFFTNDTISIDANEFSALVSQEKLRLKKISLPLMVVYRPIPRLSLDGGVNLSYVHSVARVVRRGRSTLDEEESTFQDVDFSTRSSVSYANFFSASKSQQISKVENRVINRIGVGLTGGFSYYASKNLRLSAQYHFGLNRILNIKEVQSYDRYFQITAAYFLR